MLEGLKDICSYLHDDLAKGSSISGDVEEHSGGHLDTCVVFWNREGFRAKRSCRVKSEAAFRAGGNLATLQTPAARESWLEKRGRGGRQSASLSKYRVVLCRPDCSKRPATLLIWAGF